MTEKKKRGPGRPPGSKNKKNTEPAEKKSKEKQAESASWMEPRLRDEITAIVLLAVGIFLIIALQTNLVGLVGNGISSFLKGSFGFAGYFLPYFLIVYALLVFAGLVVPFSIRTGIIMLVMYLGLVLVNSARFVEDMSFGILGIKDVYSQGKILENGGVFGMYAGRGIYELIGIVGLYMFCGVLLLICVLLLVNTPISRFFQKAKNRRELRKEERAESMTVEEQRRQDRERRWAEAALEKSRLSHLDEEDVPFIETLPKCMEPEPEVQLSMPDSPEPSWDAMDLQEEGELSPRQKNILDMVKNNAVFDNGGVKPGKPTADSRPGNSRQGDLTETNLQVSRQNDSDATEILSVLPKTPGKYILPPLDLLNKATQSSGAKGMSQGLAERATLLEHTLSSFNVEAKVTNVVAGPSVTRYEIQPAVGVKVSSIVRLADDIALNLRAKSIRLEAPIPGKAAVGIEVENERREMVTIKEIVQSREFQGHKSKLAFAVGKDIGGNAVVADLAKMPHLLIAGATGSGKSVCINTIITSILLRARPEEVKLVLIDPKMVELGNYNGIPHLLIPVVTDASKAASALNWAVAEMTGRYKKFAAEGVRDIATYNGRMRENRQRDEILPQIVVVIDELADLMMVASNQVEDAICRLAQLARGAGMHLIVATQRPSVDVITGLIKANVPSRIAFMVSSQIDSRTIIDMPGAEKLVGNGDMLFKPQDLNKPKRIQAPFISDGEVNGVIAHVKNQMEGSVEYSGEVMEQIDKGNGMAGDEDQDELLLDCIEMVVHAGQASVSMLQRRFRLGYNRAARIMDMMERRKIVGPADGAKPRMVLMTEEELDNLKEKGELD